MQRKSLRDMERDMDVGGGARSSRLIWLAAGLHLLMIGRASADPLSTAINLGTESLTACS